MTDLGWLRTRIWIALALPAAGACTKDEAKPSAAPPRAVDAAAAAKPTDARGSPDAPPSPDAAPIPADAAPVPMDAGAPKPAPWTVEHTGCSGDVWCAPRATARVWAVGKAREGGCPTTIDVPAHPGIKAPPRGEHPAFPDDGKCCVRIGSGGCKGRPFLDGDRAVVAEVDGDADAWIAAALDEHASVASFARATLELMAVGAPPALIAGCQHAALDEIAHAQGCFEMAARRGCAVEPGPLEALAPRGGGLPAVARDTFVEGCVGETIGAALAAAQRDAAEDPEERALMTRIADDEARHAALAWQTVAWAIARDPAAAVAVRAAADRARDATPIWRDVIDPTLAALLA